MKTLLAEVTPTEGETSCYFILQDFDRNKQIRENVNRASFDVVEGRKYAMVVLVYGDVGTKYTLSISGVTKAEYPTGELSIDHDGRDELGVTITG